MWSSLLLQADAVSEAADPGLWASLPEWLQKLSPILMLLVVVALILKRLPKIDVGHSEAFRKRRVQNWLPLGLTYAFLYMGRYNLTVAKNTLGDYGLMNNEDFGVIFFWGVIVYGCSFVINGPLTDKLGGRKTILIAALGSAAMNFLMGRVLEGGQTEHLRTTFSLLYAGNMYFQSFGAVSIVKVNAQWFHLRERGVFGAIFGILISLGVYFAFDWNRMILDAVKTPENHAAYWAFYIPAALLVLFFVIDFFWVRDHPSDTGHSDFDAGDASSGDDGPPVPVVQVFKKMFSNPIILTIAAIEFCSGYLRQAIMQWGAIFLKQTGQRDGFVYENWGVLLCMAGISGGVFAGTISDHIFNSRRGPVASILYVGMILGSGIMLAVLTTPWLGAILIFMSLCIIGVHGMLSGTASMDFGGKKSVGVAVGIIDGFVYLGTGLQSILLGKWLLPKGDDAAVADNWTVWPLAMMPVAVLGFLFALKVWNAKPKAKKAAAS